MNYCTYRGEGQVGLGSTFALAEAAAHAHALREAHLGFPCRCNDSCPYCEKGEFPQYPRKWLLVFKSYREHQRTTYLLREFKERTGRVLDVDGNPSGYDEPYVAIVTTDGHIVPFMEAKFLIAIG